MNDDTSPRLAPSPSADNLTLMDVLNRLGASGFTTQFGVTDDGGVMCFECRVTAAPNSLEVVSIERTEGASDPDDMLAIAAVRCPSCSARGALTLKYGPESSLEESTVLTALHQATVKGDWPAR